MTPLERVAELSEALAEKEESCTELEAALAGKEESVTELEAALAAFRRRTDGEGPGDAEQGERNIRRF